MGLLGGGAGTLAVHVDEDLRAIQVVTEGGEPRIVGVGRVRREGRPLIDGLRDLVRQGLSADHVVLDLCRDYRFLTIKGTPASGRRALSASEIGVIPAHEGVQYVVGARSTHGPKHLLVATLSVPDWQAASEALAALGCREGVVDAPWFALVNALADRPRKMRVLLHIARNRAWFVGVTEKGPGFARELHLEQGKVDFIPNVILKTLENFIESGREMGTAEVAITHEPGVERAEAESVLAGLGIPGKIGLDGYRLPAISSKVASGFDPEEFLIPIGLAARVRPEANLVKPLLTFRRTGFLKTQFRRVEDPQVMP